MQYTSTYECYVIAKPGNDMRVSNLYTKIFKAQCMQLKKYRDPQGRSQYLYTCRAAFIRTLLFPVDVSGQAVFPDQRSRI